VARPSYGASFSRKHATEEDYFENNEGEELKNNNSKTCEYQPASDSSAEEQDDDEEDDPLDSFMAGIEKTAKKDMEAIGKKKVAKKRRKRYT